MLAAEALTGAVARELHVEDVFDVALQDKRVRAVGILLRYAGVDVHSFRHRLASI